MEFSTENITRERVKTELSYPFPVTLMVALCVLVGALGWQTYRLITHEPAPVEGVVEIDMRVVQGQWQWEPDVISVPQGSAVQLSITNEDGFAHGFAIAELALDRRLPGGQTTLVEFEAALAPGEYDFFCSVFCGAGHFGQRGTLVVTEGVDTGVAPLADDRSDIPVRNRQQAIAELPFEMLDDGIKEFHLTVEEVMWDYGDGNPIYSWGYNGQLPGPDIRVVEGDRVRIHVTNKLPESTTVHWHGIDLSWEADGVPGVTMDPIKTGETYTYEFTAYPAGTRFYHTHGSHHGDEHKQMDMGLAGAFIVEPRDFDEVRPDHDVTWVLTERIQSGIFPIHGAVFPAVPPIIVREGDLVRIRMINAGSSTFHPMHLHGHQFKVVAVDGNPIPEVAQLTRNVQPILPGETYDVEFVADNPGHWLLHCHELHHAAGGMIAEVIYEDWSPPADFRLHEHH